MKERFNSALCIAKKTVVPFKFLKFGLFLLWLSALVAPVSAAPSRIVASVSPSGKITLTASNTPLRQLFNSIEEQSGYVFLISDASDAELGKRVTLDIKDAELAEALKQVLSGTGLAYLITERQITIYNKNTPAPKAAKPAAVSAQNSAKQGPVITGNVSDSRGVPLPGVTVLIKGTTTGVATGLDGSFSIKVPGRESILAFSYVGYVTKEERVDSRRIINVELAEDVGQLKEVVVVGFGVQEKASVIGAIATIEPKSLGSTSKIALSQSLAGNIPGIIAVQRSGELGNDRADFWIRGISTFAEGGARNPLVIVDGVERDFNAIDPQEIESFSVMKDASATAVYGVRGANGVIAITTKKGVEGRPKINVNVETSLKQPTVTPDFVDAATFMKIGNLFHQQGGGIGKLFSDERITNTINRTDPDLYPDVNWVKSLTKDYTNYSRVNLNVTGGAPKVRYFVSASYHNEGGLYKTDTDREWDSNIRLNKVNFRSNTDVDITPTTNINLNIGSQFQQVNGPITSVDDLWRMMIEMAPNLVPMRYSDGQISRTISSNTPYAWLTQWGYRKSASNSLNSTASLSQKLDFVTKGLSARVLFAYDINTYNSLSGKFTPDMLYATGRDADGGLVGTRFEGSPFLDKSKSSWMDYTTYLEATINYERSFGDHRVTAMLLYNQREYNVASGSGEYTILPYQNQGLAGRLTYNYKYKYFIEGNFGWNGSENFASGKRFGFFPAVALGWYISEEPFWEGIKKVLPKFKLRGSIGTVGNDKLGSTRFAYITEVVNGASYNFGSVSTYNPVTGLTEGKFGAPNLTWETETKRDVGLEINLLGSIDINIDYFYNNRKDIFTQRRIIPGTAGFTQAPWANLGKMENRGLDFSVVYRFHNENWDVSAIGNFTYARNKITDWDEPVPRFPNLYKTNHRLDQQFGLIAERLYTAEDFDASGKLLRQYAIPELGLDVKPGDIKYTDVNGDGIINTDDYTAIGYSDNPEIVYGFGVNAAYKGFDFGIRFQGVAHTTRMINDLQILPFTQGQDKGNIYKDIANSMWTESNPRQDVFLPRMRNGYNGHNFQNSTWWQRDMGFLRIKDIVLGYSFKTSLLNKLRIERARIYVIGNNLFTFSDFDLWDVELGTTNGSKYPIMRSVSIGLEVNF